MLGLGMAEFVLSYDGSWRLINSVCVILAQGPC